jgi:hypothetical protein
MAWNVAWYAPWFKIEICDERFASQPELLKYMVVFPVWTQLCKSLTKVHKQLSVVPWETKIVAGTMQRLGVPFQNTANTGLQPSIVSRFSISVLATSFLTVNSGTHLEMSILGMSCRLKNTSTNLLQQYLWSMLQPCKLVFWSFLPSVVEITHGMFYWQIAYFCLAERTSAQQKPFVSKYLRCPEGARDHTDVRSI